MLNSFVIIPQTMISQLLGKLLRTKLISCLRNFVLKGKQHLSNQDSLHPLRTLKKRLKVIIDIQAYQKKFYHQIQKIKTNLRFLLKE